MAANYEEGLCEGRGTTPPSTNHSAHVGEANARRVRVASKHRLYSVASDLGQVRVVHTTGTQVRHMAVAALVRTEVETRSLLRGFQTSR